MIDFKDIPQLLREEGEKYAEYCSQYEYMDDMSDVILAKLISSHEGSEASKKQKALADQTYTEHLEIVRTCRHDMLKAKAHVTALEARFEWYRTMNANSRAEMKL